MDMIFIQRHRDWGKATSNPFDVCNCSPLTVITKTPVRVDDAIVNDGGTLMMFSSVKTELSPLSSLLLSLLRPHGLTAMTGDE